MCPGKAEPVFAYRGPDSTREGPSPRIRSFQVAPRNELISCVFLYPRTQRLATIYQDDLPMPETKISRSPLTRLVLFIICMAVAASILAGVLYLAVDLPGQQQAIKAPENKFVAPWWDTSCFEACGNRFLAHEINWAGLEACYHTCCGGGLTC